MDQITAILLFLLAAFGLLAGVYGIYLTNQLKKRVLGILVEIDPSQSLVKTLDEYLNKVNTTQKSLDKIQKSYKHLSEIAATSLQKTALVRFNPFKDTGGDQSFVLAMLDNHDSGFLLTSIHSREGTRVYIKPISYGSSDYTLSKEEQSALGIAQKLNFKE